MKTVGLLGGMSWESTEHYYRLINEGVRNALGGLHSASIAMVSVDFADIETLQHTGDWSETARILTDKACQVEAAGADFLLICTNTMHKVADEIANAIGIPLIHIADATAQAINASGITNIGLLGTRFTMEQDFYRSKLEQSGLSVVVPSAADRQRVHDIIYKELCVGQVSDRSRATYLDVIDGLQRQGAQGIIAGCTEIGLLINQSHLSLPLFDTTAIHAQSAVDAALAD
ncbi:MAG: aspartate/glutamate racemase family protein [Pseudomonadota bacterium]